MRRVCVAMVLVVLAAVGCNTIPRTIRGAGAMARDIGDGLYLDGAAAVTALQGISLFGGRTPPKEVRDD